MSTTRALPQIWTQVAIGDITMPFTSSSMNWLASPLGYSEAALAGVRVWVACDGLQKSIEVQEQLYRRTLELIDHHPLVKNYPFKDAKVNGDSALDYWIRTSKARIGITLKPHPPEEAVKTARYFYETYGVDTFRLYDPGGTQGMITTARLLEKSGLPLNLVVGQVMNVEQAKQLAKLEVVKVMIAGVGEGGHCTTASKLGIYPNNILILYEIARLGLDKPVMADGGPGLEGLLTVLMTGGSGVMLSGGIYGGTFEHPPLLWFQDEKGRLFKITMGEASARTKWLGGNLFSSGHIQNEEGETGYKFVNLGNPTVASRIFEAAGTCIKGFRFLREPNADSLRLNPEPRMVRGSTTADKLRNAHVMQLPPRAFVNRISNLCDLLLG